MSKKTDEFKSWMDSRGLKAADVAASLHVEEQTVRIWRSQGIPPRRLPHVAKYMAEWIDPAATGPPPSLPHVSDAAVQQFADERQNLVLHPSTQQFNAWTAAFKHSSAATLQQWAIDGLEHLAATYHTAPAALDLPAPGKPHAKKRAQAS